MRILFLDIDGVICTQEEIFHDPAKKKSGEIRVEDYMRKVDGKWLHVFSPVAVAALNHITDTTGAKLVISSVWKNNGMERLVEHFKEQGVKGEIIGLTPYVYNEEYKCRMRGGEIQAWLDANPKPESFVILDDESDMLHLLPRLVQTMWDDFEVTGEPEGLVMKHAERAIAMLGEPNVY